MELQIQEPTVNSERRKYVNFVKADWDGFKSFMEDSIQNLPQGDLLQSERAFRNKMQKAARKFIPVVEEWADQVGVVEVPMY